MVLYGLQRDESAMALIAKTMSAHTVGGVVGDMPKKKHDTG